MIAGIAVHSSVRRYRMPTQLGIADHEIGRISQRWGMVQRVHRYKLIKMGRPGLAVPAQIVLARPAIYRKSRYKAGLTLQCISHNQRAGWPDVYIVYFYDLHPDWPDVFARITRPLVAVRQYPQTSVYIYIYIYMYM